MAEKTFGEMLKTLRINKKLTKTQLAAQLNLKYTTLANYENNKREPAFATLKRMAAFFDVTVDCLLGNTASAKLTSEQELELQPAIKEATNHLRLALHLLHNLGFAENGDR